MKKSFFAVYLVAISILSCSKNSASPNPPDPTDTTTNNASFAKGGDISWLTEMEAQVINFMIAADNRKTYTKY